jgi:PleD family two-component response regulator/EAL domain-containing protein (putative c-di-GMP-specific phosphodiesterase class I)
MPSRVVRAEDSQASAELRQAFTNHLPRRIELVQKRVQRLVKGAFDINSLTVLSQEVQNLAGASGRYGLMGPSERLYALELKLEAALLRATELSEEQKAEFEALSLALTRVREADVVVRVSFDDFVPALDQLAAQHAFSVPPSEHWRRFSVEAIAPFSSDDAGLGLKPADIFGLSMTPAAGSDVDDGLIELVIESNDELLLDSGDQSALNRDHFGSIVPVAHRLMAQSITPIDSDDGFAAPLASPAPQADEDEVEIDVLVAAPAAPIPPAPPRTVPIATLRVFYLAPEAGMYAELAPRLSAHGLSVDRLESTEELVDTLSSMTADLVVIDEVFSGQLELVGDFLKTLRQRTTVRMPIVAFADANDLSARIRAMRSGVDVLLPTKTSADVAFAKLKEQLAHEQAVDYRILIVEDDRAQALFAESVLRKAGMETLAVTDPLRTLDALESFKPDLILMDLYMPGIDGMELTAIIRERDEFISTPIVFLSGEQDSDKQFDALSAGGDDFLSKPIRPKHLISAVTNRAHRARLLRARRDSKTRDQHSGLFDRSVLLDRLAAALVVEDRNALMGGVLLIEIDGAAKLREELGLSGMDSLTNQLGSQVRELLRNDEPVFSASSQESRRLGDTANESRRLGDTANESRRLGDTANESRRLGDTANESRRLGDTANESAARYGDGSLVLLSTTRDTQALMELAQNLRQRVALQAFEVDGKTLQLSLSAGVCGFAQALAEPSAMLNCAERAMNQARLNPGDARVALYQPEVVLAKSEATLLEDAIRRALKEDNFQLMFQPIVALQDTGEEQYEVLLRLRDGGRIYTGEQLLDSAQTHGLVQEIDRWTLSRCMATLDERRRQGRGGLRLFVEQSGASLKDSQRIAWLRQSLETRRLDASMLCLEFRLSDIMRELKLAVPFFQAARALGLKMTLSGFESNLTALQVLSYLPVDNIKLAEKYLDAAAANSAELKSLIAAAHDGKRRVIAARVENAQSASTLFSLGVDFIQGNFVQQAGAELAFDFQASGR